MRRVAGTSTGRYRTSPGKTGYALAGRAGAREQLRVAGLGAVVPPLEQRLAARGWIADRGPQPVDVGAHPLDGPQPAARCGLEPDRRLVVGSPAPAPSEHEASCLPEAFLS